MSNAIVPVVPKRNAVTGAGYPASLALGEIAVNTTTGNVYLGADPGVVQIGIPVAAGTTTNLGTGDGSTIAYTIAGGTGTDAGGYIVSVGGIDQPSGWTVAGTTLTFSEAPPAGAAVSVRAILKGEGGGGGGTDIGGRAWDAAATYTEGDLVATSQRETWICIQNANTGNDPATSPTWWAPQPADAVSLQGTSLVYPFEPSNTDLLAFNGTAWVPVSPLQLGIESSTYGSGNSIRIGNDTVSNNSGIAIGGSAGANPYGSGVVNDTIAIGFSSNAFGPYGISIGNNSSTSNSDSIAIGRSASAVNGGIALGATSGANGNLSISAANLTSGSPSNTIDPVAWLNIVVNGTQCYIPLHQ